MKKKFKKIMSLFLCTVLLSPTSTSVVFADESEIDTVYVNVTYGQTEARSMLDMVNEFRTGDEAWAWNEDNSEKVYYTDLDELVYDYDLEQIAMQRAAEIALSYSHTRPNGESCFSLYTFYNSAGENIAAGYTTASEVFEAWQETNDDYNGQGHRRNMLYSSFTTIGIGHAYFNGTHYWVQEFRNPASDADFTTAVDTETTVPVDILLSDAEVSVTSNPDSIKIPVNETVDLPLLDTTIQMSNAWPSRTSTVSTDYVWSVEDEQYAEISGNTVKGITQGTTTLTTTTLGKTISIPLTITCNHTYDEGTITQNPTCTTDGVKTYTCSLCGSSYTEDIPAVGHSYGEPEFVWADDYSCTAIFTCLEGDDEQHINCTVTSETTPATAVADGKTVYTAAVSFNDNEYTDSKTVIIPATALDTPVISSVYSTVQTSVKVTWSKIEEADGYELWRSTTPDDPFVLTKTITDPDKVSYTNQGLTIGQTYYYKVRAYVLDGNDNKIYSDYSEVRYMPSTVTYENVYSNSTSRIRFLWNAVDGAEGYQLWRSDSENGTYKIVKTINSGSVTAYSNTGLTSGNTYYYKMRAYTKVNDQMVFGTFSDIIQVAVMPEPPVFSAENTAPGKVNLSWEPVNGASGYQIWRSDTQDGTYKIIKSISDGSTISYTNSQLTAGETYYYKMRSYTELDGKKTFSPYSEIQTVEIIK